MKSFFKPVLFLFALIIVFFSVSYGADCPQCIRRGAAGDCENLALPPDFRENEKEWLDCLTLAMGYNLGDEWLVGFEDEEKYEAAKLTCKEFEPDYGREFSVADGEAIRSTIESWLSILFHSDRFGMYKIDKEEADYIFEATYDCAEIPNVDIVDGRERYPATLNLRMYYNGEEKELVKEWTLENTIHSMTGIINKMFKNEDALMRSEIPLEKLMDKFEKMPVTCSIQPEKDTCSYNTKMKINIKDLRDAFGEKSREFCRIAVAVKEGRILNGTTPRGVGEGKVAVFQIGKGDVEVEYEAPDTSLEEHETVTVFHCHDVAKLSTVSLARTNISKKVISEGTIPFSLPGVTATLEVTYSHSRNEDRTYGQRNVVQKDWHEDKKASVMFVFDETPRVSRDFDPGTGKIHVTRYRYSVRDVKILSAGGGGNGNENSDISGTHIVSQTHTYIQYPVYELDGSADRLVLDVDPDTGLIVKAELPKIILHGKITGKRTGTKYVSGTSYDISSDMDYETELTVNQEFGDYDSAEYKKVLEGDGKTVLRGGLSSEQKGKYTVTKQTSTWTVTITPKQ